VFNFTSLYKVAADGKLGDHTVFHQLAGVDREKLHCEVFHDRLQRESSDNKGKKVGVRYKVDYLNLRLEYAHGTPAAFLCRF